MLLTLAGMAAAQHTSATLPPVLRDLPDRAVVTTDAEIVWPTKGRIPPSCSRFHVTRGSLAGMLRSYHELTINELDQYQSDGGCELRGRITLDGRQYRWRKYRGNELQIEWSGDGGGAAVLGGQPNPAPPLTPAQQRRERYRQKHEKPPRDIRQPIVLLLNHDFALPADAIIHLGKPKVDAGQPDRSSRSCEGVPKTDAAVRRIFRTYHELASGELHDSYASYGCGVSGTVLWNQRTFRFDYSNGNTLTTNYPDGFDHLMGGAYTDDPGVGG